MPMRTTAALPLTPATAPAVDPLLTARIFPTLVRFALPNMGARLATALAAIAETV